MARETVDPELTIDRALETYLKTGYSPEWINQRLQAIQVRRELTNEWDSRGVKKGVELTPEQFNEICNGCGSHHALVDCVPDSFLGADMWIACCAHDYAYWLGLDKAKADREFLHNLCLACFDDNTVKYTARTMIAFKYFQAVVLCGENSFGVK